MRAGRAAVASAKFREVAWKLRAVARIVKEVVEAANTVRAPADTIGATILASW